MRNYYDYGPVMTHGDWWFGLAGLGLWLLFMILTILIVVRLLRHHGPGMYPHHRDPLDIIRDRYAKGEIDKEQYEQLKKDLK